MKIKYTILGFILTCGILNAQPDENYIKKLTGEIDQDWLGSVGNSIPVQQFQWTVRKAPGFDRGEPAARKQACLSQPWRFFKVATSGTISKETDVILPHNFEKHRDYKAGWYFIKYQLNKTAGKRYVLMLNRIDMFSIVYVNGKRCGHHFGRFTPFEMDITDAVVQSDNVLAIFVYDQSASIDGKKAYNQLSTVKVNQVQEFAGGITDVPMLEIRESAYVKDVFLKTSTRKRELEIEYEIVSKTELSANSKLTFELLKWPDGESAGLEIPTIPLTESPDRVRACKIKWPNPNLWSPDHPNLYVIRATLQNGNNRDVLDTRFGFREFWIEGKSFVLNGVPIRLRGTSYIYQPMRKELFDMHKELFGSNACRLHASIPPGDVVHRADEVGMLLDNQSAIWSTNAGIYKNGGDWFLKNTAIEFEEWVRRDRNSPSVVIWDVENEMLRINFEAHFPWVEKLSGFIRKFDDTRPITNSGAGWFSPSQDMVWLHQQEHYSKIMSDWKTRGTTPLVMGEFWVGGRGEDRLPHSPELNSASQRIVEEAKIFEERMLEMRYQGVSGVMPFKMSRIAFSQAPRFRHGLQPVTVFFWPRQNYVAAGKSFQRELVICNDGETANNFEITWQWGDHASHSTTLCLQPATQQRIVIDAEPPVRTAELTAAVRMGNTVISSDTLSISPMVLPKADFGKAIHVYKDQNLARTLAAAGFKAFSDNSVPDVSDRVLFLIPEHANNRELNLLKNKILTYLGSGGNILCLKQDQTPTWFPVKLPYWSSSQTAPRNYSLMGWAGLNKDLFFSTVAPILAASHPIFSEMDGATLHWWDKFDGRVSDDVFVRPSNVNKYEQGNWRPLAGGTRREHVSIAEIFYGKGTMLSCQLNVMDNLENVQAKNLFIQMLKYLSGKRAADLGQRIAVRGTLKSADIAALTGASAEAFAGATAQNHDLMIASEGADISEIRDWASRGGRVFVLSVGLSLAFDGVKFGTDGEKLYVTTKTLDHPLLYGVSAANFLNVDLPVVKGYFSSIPAQSKVLLQGFSTDRSRSRTNLSDLWEIEDAGPVMVSLPYGKGEILLSTIEIRNQASTSAREFLCLVLTNTGVPVPYHLVKAEEVAIKRTVPITIDGSLKEWLEDMEDRLVTQYTHAQPVYLTSESIVEGPPAFDLDLSAINYYLWDERALYIAGVVFSGKKEYAMNIWYNQDVINVSLLNNEAKVSVNGRTDGNALIKTGQIDSMNLTDAAVLQFNYIYKSGKIASVDNLVGETFELMIPWDLLKSKPSDETTRALVSVESQGSKIQVPLSANPQCREDWMDMRIQDDVKR